MNVIEFNEDNLTLNEIDKTNRNINLRLLMHFIFNKDYSKAYEILACMYNTEDKAIIKDALADPAHTRRPARPE